MSPLGSSVTARQTSWWCPGAAWLVSSVFSSASDGSHYSQAAWELALAMAKQAKSRLIGVAVAPEEGDIIEAKAIIRRMLTAASLAGVPMKGVGPQGVAPDTGIVQQAIKNEVDLIVVGSYGRTGLKKLLMGSVTERVIGGSPCPVLGWSNSLAESGWGRKGRDRGTAGVPATPPAAAII